MGLFGDLLKQVATEAVQSFVDGILEGVNEQNNNCANAATTQLDNADISHNDALEEQIRCLPFDEIKHMQSSDEYTPEENSIAKMIINERMEYLQTVSSDTFSDWDDDELLDYYYESRKKSSFAFGAYADIVLDAIFGQIYSRMQLHMTYGLKLSSEFEALPYSLLVKIATANENPKPDKLMINVANAIIERRKKYMFCTDIELSKHDDEKFIREFYIIRRLGDRYYNCSVENLFNKCMFELIKNRSEETLNNFIYNLYEDDYKNFNEKSDEELQLIADMQPQEYNYQKYDVFDSYIAKLMLEYEEE